MMYQHYHCHSPDLQEWGTAWREAYGLDENEGQVWHAILQQAALEAVQLWK